VLLERDRCVVLKLEVRAHAAELLSAAAAAVKKPCTLKLGAVETAVWFEAPRWYSNRLSLTTRDMDRCDFRHLQRTGLSEGGQREPVLNTSAGFEPDGGFNSAEFERAGLLTGGGSSGQKFSSVSSHFEFQNYTSVALEKHFLRLGGRLRSTGEDLTSTSVRMAALLTPICWTLAPTERDEQAVELRCDGRGRDGMRST